MPSSRTTAWVIRVIRADKTRMAWPLEISYTICKEYSRKLNGVHHGSQVSSLLEPVLLNTTKTEAKCKTLLARLFLIYQPCLGFQTLADDDSDEHVFY